MITIRYTDETGIDNCFSSETMSVVPYFTKNCKMLITPINIIYKNKTEDIENVLYVEDNINGYYVKYDPNEISDFVLHSLEHPAEFRINYKLISTTNYRSDKKYYIDGYRYSEIDWIKYKRKNKIKKVFNI